MKKNLLAAALVASSAATVQAGSVTSDGQDLVISTKGGLKVATQDKSASFKLGGRMQWDYDATQSDDNDKDTTDFDVRRARIYVKGHVGDWGYKAQFNVAESDGAKGGNAEDLYIQYNGFGKAAKIKVGKQSEPFGLERLTSSKDTSSLERSALTEFHTPGRAAGVQLHGKGKNWTYGVGYFEADGNGSNDFEHNALTGRVTFAPLQTKTSVIHVGASGTSRDAEDSADEVDTFGLEAGAATGPFHVQAEYFDSEMGDESLDGFYLQAGWVVTGEQRPYKDGKFKRVKPSAKSGAWELVLRYEDGDGKYTDVGLDKSQKFNGEQTTFGVNYYPSKYARLGLSYMDAEAEDADGKSYSGDELRARIQFAF